MQISYKTNIGVKEYKETFGQSAPERPYKCSYCPCLKIYSWGKYYRYVVWEDGEELIPIRRFCCAKCRRTQSYLPDFCLSGRQYAVGFVMMLLETLLCLGKVYKEELRHQIYRYKKLFTSKLSAIVIFLRGRGQAAIPESPEERVVAVLNSLLAHHRLGELTNRYFEDTGQHFLAQKMQATAQISA